ncbi:MAG: hypothetical protein ABR985_13555 [Methanotrichaceae archaeon]
MNYDQKISVSFCKLSLVFWLSLPFCQRLPYHLNTRTFDLLVNLERGAGAIDGFCPLAEPIQRSAHVPKGVSLAVSVSDLASNRQMLLEILSP